VVADPVALQGFVEKWLAREPGMALLEVFVPPAQRSLFRAWGAVSAELVECVFELGEREVARTKLAWWSEDLCAWTAGRHPLVRALAAEPVAAVPDAARWRRMLIEAVALLDSPHQPASVEQARAELLPFAEALAQIEADLLGATVDSPTLALHLQLERSLRGLLGIHPQRSRIVPAGVHPPSSGATQEYANQLRDLARVPVAGGLLTAYRQLLSEERSRRLARRGDPAHALNLPAWRSLWLGWRAARRARARVDG
jgi:hypothetical protein